MRKGSLDHGGVHMEKDEGALHSEEIEQGAERRLPAEGKDGSVPRIHGLVAAAQLLVIHRPCVRPGMAFHLFHRFGGSQRESALSHVVARVPVVAGAPDRLAFLYLEQALVRGLSQVELEEGPKPLLVGNLEGLAPVIEVVHLPAIHGGAVRLLMSRRFQDSFAVQAASEERPPRTGP